MMGVSRAAWLGAGALLLVACGRWGFSPLNDDGGSDDPPDAAAGDAPPGDGDGGPADGGGPADAAVADATIGPVCKSGTFGAPQLVTGLGLPPDMFGPKISADGATLTFSRLGNNDVSEDIHTAMRLGPTSFAAAQPLATVNTNTQDGTPWVSLDGLTLLFSSERSGGLGQRDLWLAMRPTTADDFAVVRNLSEINSSRTDHTASMTADGLTIFWGTDRENNPGGEDIYTASRASPGAMFGTPSKVPELSSSSHEGSVFISADGLSVYFMSERPGGAGCGDIWFATRAQAGAPFSTPQPVGELNSVDCEDDPALSADGCEIFFSSDRGGGYEIYRAVRTP